MNSKRDNMSLACSGLAIATTAAMVKTLNNTHYQIAGRAYFKAAADNLPLVALVQSPVVPFVALTASQVGVFFILMDATGTVAVRQAPAKPGVTSALYQPGFFEWPQEDPAYAIIGAVRVATNASGAFNPSVTSLAAANQTVTYFNVAQDLGVPIPY